MLNRSVMTTAVIALLGLVSAGSAAQPQPPQHQHEHSMPQNDGGPAAQKHYQDVNRHGDVAMGFSHLKTTHHFRLTPSGGFIQVQANDPADAASRSAIQAHLRHISKAFKEGDFSAPEFTHGRVPPGVRAMQRLKSQIDYKYVETKAGGKVLITTANPRALEAIHQFLRFQISDHRTGDPTTVQK
jgi:hypothetical protein